MLPPFDRLRAGIGLAISEEMVARARGTTLRIVAAVLAAGLLWLSAEIATGLTIRGGLIDVSWCLLSASRSR